MKTLLGFIALLLYTFSMLAWGHLDAARLYSCRVPFDHPVSLSCAKPSDSSAPAGK